MRWLKRMVSYSQLLADYENELYRLRMDSIKTDDVDEKRRISDRESILVMEIQVLEDILGITKKSVY